MKKPLKVYYCLDCGCRMPLYYKKDARFRDDLWHHCFSCGKTNLDVQIEEWDYEREKMAKDAVTPEQRRYIRQSARIYAGDPSQYVPAETSKAKNWWD